MVLTVGAGAQEPSFVGIGFPEASPPSVEGLHVYQDSIVVTVERPGYGSYSGDDEIKSRKGAFLQHLEAFLLTLETALVEDFDAQNVEFQVELRRDQEEKFFRRQFYHHYAVVRITCESPEPLRVETNCIHKVSVNGKYYRAWRRDGMSRVRQDDQGRFMHRFFVNVYRPGYDSYSGDRERFREEPAFAAALSQAGTDLAAQLRENGANEVSIAKEVHRQTTRLDSNESGYYGVLHVRYSAPKPLQIRIRTLRRIWVEPAEAD